MSGQKLPQKRASGFSSPSCSSPSSRKVSLKTSKSGLPHADEGSPASAATPVDLAHLSLKSKLTTKELLNQQVDHTNDQLYKITKEASATEVDAEERLQAWSSRMGQYIASLEVATKDTVLKYTVPEDEKEYKKRLSLEEQDQAVDDKNRRKGRYSQTRNFQVTITALIMINSVLLGLQVDHPVEEYPKVGRALEMVDNVFVAIWVIEMLWKFHDLGWKYFKNWWNCSDFVIVSVSIADILMKISYTLGGVDGEQPDLGVLKVLRIFRMLRIARILRLVRHFEALFLIVSGFINALYPIFWVVALLMIINYCIAILITSEVGHDPRYDLTEEWNDTFNAKMYFGSMTRTMFTLCQAIIGAEFTEWSRPIYETQPEMLLPILIFTVICNFGVVNVIIGVICDSTKEAAEKAENDSSNLELKKRRIIAEEILQFIHTSGISDDNVVSLTEFEEWLQSRDFKIEELNVPLAVSARELYEFLDTEGMGNVQTTTLIKNLFRLTQQNKSSALFLVQMALNRLSKVEFKTEKRLSKIEGLIRKQLGIKEPNQYQDVAVQTSKNEEGDISWMNHFRTHVIQHGPTAGPSLRNSPCPSDRELGKSPEVTITTPRELG